MKKYNVVIVGAGPGGLECAYNLGGSELNVLLIEKNKIIGPKVCAGGLTPKNLNWIPKELLDSSFKQAYIHYQKQSFKISQSDDLIATVNRQKLGHYQLNKLKKFSNIEILTGIYVKQIFSNGSLILSNDKLIYFDFLVGADGAFSEVRKHLKLPTKKLSIAIQYIIPKQFDKLEIFFDNKLWGTGYSWIFPHKDYDSIGCGTDINFLNIKKLKSNFDYWLEKQRIDLKNAKFEAAPINCDYRGYQFDNIFLAGDAAGLTSGVTREGIYPAVISGRQIAWDILGINKKDNLIKKWLIQKRKQEKYLFVLKSPAFVKFLIFSTLFLLTKSQRVQSKLKNIFLS
ncbi:NAD(P)/FAD-dependent oxidoreductase [Patescibacteria group bacterium]